MFEAKLSKSANLKKLIDVIKDLVTDAPIDCNEYGITLQSMDGAHVALVSMKLGSGMFEIYRIDRSISLGISMKNMAMALKCAGNDDSCLIQYDESNDTSLQLTFVDEKLCREQAITLKLMDIEQENLGVPDQKYHAIIDMSSAEFHKAEAGKVKFEAVGGDNGGNVVTYTSAQGIKEEMDSDEENDESEKKKKKKKDDDTPVLISVTESVKSSFSVKYLTQFAKAYKLADRVRVCMSTRMPIVIEYKVDDDGLLKYFLAPKIEDEV